MKVIWKYLVGVLVGLLITVAIIVPVLLLQNDPIITPPDEMVEHDPIMIWKNEDFLDYDFEGTGTEQDPHLINNLNITTFTTYAIYIFGTTDYFVIQNCLLRSTHENGNSIRLENVANGSATIFNNTIRSDFWGIYLSNTDSSQIIQNKFEYCHYALSLSSADETIIYNNYFYNINENFLFHIIGSGSKNINITENVFDGKNSAILLDYCSDALLIKNHMDNVSFLLTYSHRSLISNNTGIEFNILLTFSIGINITFNEGRYFSSVQSPQSKLEYNNFFDYQIREVSIEDYASYQVHSNLAGNGLFIFTVSADYINLAHTLSLGTQILFVNCSDIWLYNLNEALGDVKIDLIFCSDIEFINNEYVISVNLKECNNVTISDNSFMHFNLDDADFVTFANNSFLETDVYCAGAANLVFTENTFTQSEISLVECTNSYIFNNHFFDGHVEVFRNYNSSVLTNTFESCEYGITITDSDKITANDNIFTYVYGNGPRLSRSDYVVFQNNSISGDLCGFNFYGNIGDYNTFTITNNSVNSKPLGYYVNQQDLILDNIAFGQLILINCSSALIRNIVISNTSAAIEVYLSEHLNLTNVTISSCYNGIGIFNSENCTLTDITVHDASNIGIYVYRSDGTYLSESICYQNTVGIYISFSDYCIIENNTCYENEDGMRVIYSDFVTIHNNTFSENSNRGLLISGAVQVECNVTYNLFLNNVGYAIEISLYSTDHIIHHNAFIGNNQGGTSQALDKEGGSQWYDSLTLEGNYWDTWSGVGSYPIDWEVTSVVDPYPLDTNPLV